MTDFRILQGQPELTPTLSCTDMARFAIDMLRALKSPQEHHWKHAPMVKTIGRPGLRRKTRGYYFPMNIGNWQICLSLNHKNCSVVNNNNS